MSWILQVFNHLEYRHCIKPPVSEPSAKVLIQIHLMVWKLEPLVRHLEVASRDRVRRIVESLRPCSRAATQIQDLGSRRNVLAE